VKAIWEGDSGTVVSALTSPFRDDESTKKSTSSAVKAVKLLPKQHQLRRQRLNRNPKAWRHNRDESMFQKITVCSLNLWTREQSRWS
jgi:hypothetical protein